MTRDDRLRIAVFIDFDNIEIGVKNTLGASFDAGLVLEALRERGDVVSKTAYSDWQRAGNYSRMLTQHAIKMVQRNLTPGGDKNGADINLALDALEMAFTHPHINAFVIVGGDSDFISLVEKLKQYDKKVFVVGGRQFTSVIMQRNCHEFIAYENLASASSASHGGRRQQGRDVRVDRAPIEQAIPLVSRALQVLSEREVSPQLGLLKTTLLQLDSTFSERNYGAGSFRDFVQKLEKVGVVTLQQAKGGLLVMPGDAAVPAEIAAAPVEEAEAQSHAAVNGTNGSENGQPQPRGDRQSGPAPAVVGSNADGIAEFRRILGSGQVRRWPMYLRNVKQLVRQVSPDFDERAYGFANLVDLLRAAGRENIVRVDRDRQGVIRVFQGAATPTMPPVFMSPDLEAEIEAAERAALIARGELPPDPAPEADDAEAPATVLEFPNAEPNGRAADTIDVEAESVTEVESDDEPNGNVAEPAAAEAPKRPSRRRASSSSRTRKKAAGESSSEAAPRSRTTSSRTRRTRKS